MSWKEIDQALEAIRALCPSRVPLTIDTHDAGRRIAAKYGYSMFDGLIAASALEARCDTLYSEDFQDGQLIDGRLTVRNPFVQ
jgi:predicted nucleic acid-binding protein